MEAIVKRIIKKNNEEIETISSWMYHWWGSVEGYSYDKIRDYIYYGIKETGYPQTYGLYVDDKLVGVYQIRLDDLFVRPDLYPWLANVYIDENYRGLGLGKVLMESVIENARENCEFQYLYLYTTHVGLYEKYGWTYFQDVETYLHPSLQRLYRLNLKNELEIVNGINYLDEVKNLIIEYTSWLGRDLSFQNLEGELLDIKHKYTAPEGELLVALVNNEVAGMVAYYRHNTTRCEMKRLFVLDKYKGRGIGERLVEEIENHARRSGYKEMVLDTIEPLKAAIHLYKKHGFIECEAYYHNPMDDVIYFKKTL